MEIDLKTIDTENFLIKDGFICDVPAVLINPKHMGADWNDDNLIFRSSIWYKETGDLLSAGFPKFFNLGEKPDLIPPPTDLKGCNIINKIDGSLCCVDLLYGKLNARTRGTFNYTTLDNASDFEYCLNKYPKIKDWLAFEPTLTLLFEITSPNNRIVIKYGDEPDLTLIGAVDKVDYSLLMQSDVDYISNVIDVKRPKRYEVTTLESLIKKIKESTGIEGAVLYSKNDTVLHKIKSEEYLKYHFLMTQLNDNKLLDLIDYLDYPSIEEFEKHICTEFDFECFQHIKDRVGVMYEIINEIKSKIHIAVEEFESTACDNEWLLSGYTWDNTKRADMAKYIMMNHKEVSPILFMVIDGKFDLNNDRVKKFIKNEVKEVLKSED